MKLSVAMCTYNGAAYVREQLASIAAQIRAPDELIVVDDFSNDGTLEITREFAASAPFPVRLYVNERRLGAVKSFERAISLCEGDLIALADQDDVWLPEKLRRSEAALAANPRAGLVFTDAEIVDEQLRPLGRRLWQTIGFDRSQQRRLKGGKAVEVLITGSVVTGMTMAFRSKFKRLALPIPDRISSIHDGWIALVIATVAELCFIDEPLVKYRQHADQQIGASVPSRETGVTSWRVAVARKNPYTDYLRPLEIVRERLATESEISPNEQSLQDLTAAITHYRARANLPNKKLQRLPIILRELAARRYHLYAKGVRSAAKDLFY